MHAHGARLYSAVSRAPHPHRLPTPPPARSLPGGWQQRRARTASRAPWWRRARAWLTAAMAEPMDSSPAQDSVDVRPALTATLQRTRRAVHSSRPPVPAPP